MLAIAIISIFGLLLVTAPVIFAIIQFARYKADGGKRNDLLGFIIDYLKNF